jgi:uncharacterized membrane protein YvlD (DUF360 family)
VASVNRYLNLYRTQIQVLRHWRGGGWALARRLVLVLILSTLAFAITDWIDPGIHTVGVIGAVEMVVVMAVLNAVLRPLLLFLVAPHSLLLTGLAVLVAQVVVFYAAAQLAPDVRVDNVASAVFGSFLYAFLNAVLTAAFGLDGNDSFYSLLIQQMLMQEAAPRSERPGLVIMQIDGLAYPILAGRMRAGSVNTIARWVEDGTHVLSRWEALLPSMTSASQAGILHGNNDDIPAFRWYERDRHHLMVSSNPADAAEIVRRVSDGHGLLSNNGASICNLVTGDATRAYMTTAAIHHHGRGIGESRAFLSFFFSPSGYIRALTMFFGEFFKEQIQARRTRRSGMRPQLQRGFKFAGMRAASNVVIRQLNTSLVIEEMYRGTNVIYADFTGYDEMAHHCGPERVESFDSLDGADRALATIERAAEHAPPAVPIRCPVRPRPEPRRDVQAALRQEPRRSRARSDGRSGDRVPINQPWRERRGTRLVSVGGHAKRGGRTCDGARGARGPNIRRRRREHRPCGDAAARVAVHRCRRRLRQSRPGVVHRARRAVDHRGTRGVAPGTGQVGG